MGLRWPCTFHVVCAHFIHVGYPTRTQFAVEYGLKVFLEISRIILEGLMLGEVVAPRD